MMPPTDATYAALVSLAATVARALRRGLPPGWQMRLEATAPADVKPGWIWLHAVSVGELLLAKGLTAKLLEAGLRVHITTGTPAGLALLKNRIPQWNLGRELLSGGAFPVDDAAGLRGFFRNPPGAFIALETELWPNLMRQLEARGIPRIIVNGRLTKRSLGRAGMGGKWLRRAAERLSLVAARDAESARAFSALGAPQVALGGNLKADLPSPAPLADSWAGLRLGWQFDAIIVAGSTLEGEEGLLLTAWKQLRATHPALRLILAPRQPVRFQTVAELLKEQRCAFVQASAPWPKNPSQWQKIDVLLLDTLGDLPAAYGEGTLALVGGGWRGTGGHNPLEPVRWGLPTFIGPGYGNFQDLVEPLQAAGRVKVLQESELIVGIHAALESAPLRSLGWDKNSPLPEGLLGALEKTWALIRPFLPRQA